MAALVFAFAHVLTIVGRVAGDAFGLAVVGFGTRVPVALALGWLFLRRGTIWASFGLHAAFNGDPADHRRGVRRSGRRIRPAAAAARPRERAVHRRLTAGEASSGRLASVLEVRMAGGIGGLSSSGPRGRPLLDRIQRGSRCPDRERPDAAGRPGRAIREVPIAERPRERLALRGAGGLTSAELIGLLWGSGTRGRSALDLAADALARARRPDRAGARDGAGARGGARRRRGQGRPARRRVRARTAAAGRLAGRLAGRSADPHDIADRLDPADGPSRARGAAGRAARHEEPCPARRDRLPGQRVVVARPGRRAVPRRRPPQRGRRDPRPQPPVGRSDARPRTTCTSPPRRSPPAACSTSSCSTTSSSATTPTSRCAIAACRSTGPGPRLVRRIDRQLAPSVERSHRAAVGTCPIRASSASLWLSSID